MAHFAQINENSIVLQVIAINNSETYDETGIESEEKGVQFCRLLFGENTNWVQTSYNGSIRKNYAGIGYIYNKEFDIFYPPKPHLSWTLNENFNWQAPIPYPQDNNTYIWSEYSISWVKIISN